jgi:aspartyl-tRNA(Asn)/glutamyl-tRNA(Gln) amidotransferase subunit A
MFDWTIAQQARALADGAITSEQLTRAVLERIEAADGAHNAFISVTREHALAQARAADAARAAGRAGPLTGVPVAHKDIFCTDGVRTSCGSRMLDNFVSPYDATVVANMRDAGLVMVGKTNMDEFAMGSSNETSFYGPVRNPWDTTRVPGGSSGGSAAAVAARMVAGATGTDTGGSIRQPASLCGITGLKPSYGRVSRFGMVAFASSLDQGGPMARTAADCAHLLTAMAGFDPNDSTSIDRPVEDFAAGLDGFDLGGLKIGLPVEYFGEGMSAGVRARVDAAAETLRGLGAELVEISLPRTEASVPTYYVVAPAEASSNLSRFDGVRFGHRCKDPEDVIDLYERSRGEGFGDEVKRRIMVGTYALSAGYYDAYYLKAQKIRQLISRDFAAAFEQVHAILGPTSPSTAFTLGERSADPVAMYWSDVYTIAANLAGLPGLSMPAGFADGLPVGVQLIGPAFDERRLLGIAHQFQQATDYHAQAPAGA